MRVLHLTTEVPPVIFGGLGTSVGGLVGALADLAPTSGLLVASGPQQLRTHPPRPLRAASARTLPRACRRTASTFPLQAELTAGYCPTAARPRRTNSRTLAPAPMGKQPSRATATRRVLGTIGDSAAIAAAHACSPQRCGSRCRPRWRSRGSSNAGPRAPACERVRIHPEGSARWWVVELSVSV
jgi:hypothetical protein